MGSERSGEAYLVTGYPNFRARKMVEHVLRSESAARIFLIVREQFESEARQALSMFSPSDRARVTELSGDAAAMDMGLSGKEYKDVAARVTRIHHMAQITYPGIDAKTAENVNIGTTREVIEFGRSCPNLSSIVVFSSASISGSRTGRVFEGDLNAGQSFRSPAEETLARSELLARSFMDKLPIAIVRPTQIIGDSRSGEMDPLDGPYLLVLLIVSSPQDFPLPLPTHREALMNFVPVNYVVSAANHIASRKDSIGRTYHLTDPEPLSVGRVFELLSRSGGRRLPTGFIPTNLTKALLRTPGMQLVAKSPRAFLDLLATQVAYDTSNADEALSGTGLTCPPFEAYVDELVAFVKRRVQERRERAATNEVDDPLS